MLSCNQFTHNLCKDATNTSRRAVMYVLMNVEMAGLTEFSLAWHTLITGDSVVQWKSPPLSTSPSSRFQSKCKDKQWEKWTKAKRSTTQLDAVMRGGSIACTARKALWHRTIVAAFLSAWPLSHTHLPPSFVFPQYNLTLFLQDHQKSSQCLCSVCFQEQIMSCPIHLSCVRNLRRFVLSPSHMWHSFTKRQGLVRVYSQEWKFANSFKTE